MLEKKTYEEFMIRLYFDKGNDYLRLCIDRAYLDFPRTLRGIAKTGIAEKSRALATEELYSQFIEVRQNILNKDEFDSWHRKLCHKLQNIYSEQGFKDFYIGQGQKWINMTFKYVFTLQQVFSIAQPELQDFAPLYSFCHVPLDNILIEAFKKYDFPPFKGKWSRINDYDEYIGYQTWVRQRFKMPPLDAEFLLWSGKDIST